MIRTFVPALVPLLFLGGSWLAPEQEPLRAAERLLAEGKAEAAVQELGQALADNPDSAIVAYNLGNAHYRAKQYEAAVQTYRRIRPERAGTELGAHAAYNAGNSLFRLGELLEEQKPQDALTKYAEALVEYRRALGLAPHDADAKFNYEYTAKRLEALRKRLEEMAKQQPTPEQQQNNAAPPTPEPQSQPSSPDNPPPRSDEPPQPNESDEASSHGEQQSVPQSQEQASQQPSRPGDEQPAASTGEEQPQGHEVQQGAAGGEAVASSAEEPSDRAEARAVIDTARQEELSPTEFWRQQQHGVVAEPLQDW